MILNVLFSLAYAKDREDLYKEILQAAPRVNFLMDSGAITNFAEQTKAGTAGKTYKINVSLKTYIDFCQRYGKYLWGYIALDELWDPEGTLHNLREIAKSGLKPIPVFCEDMPVQDAHELVAVNDHICIAGWLNNKYETAVKRLAAVQTELQGNVRVHALGFGRWPEMTQIPLFSMDALTWMSGARFGIATRFDQYRGISYYRRSSRKLPPKQIVSVLSKYKIDPRDINSNAHWKGGLDPSIPVSTSIVSYFQLMRYMETLGRYYFIVFDSTHSRTYVSHMLSILQAVTDWDTFTFSYDHYKSQVRVNRKKDVPDLWHGVNQYVELHLSDKGLSPTL